MTSNRPAQLFAPPGNDGERIKYASAFQKHLQLCSFLKMLPKKNCVSIHFYLTLVVVCFVDIHAVEKAKGKKTGLDFKLLRPHSVTLKGKVYVIFSTLLLT